MFFPVNLATMFGFTNLRNNVERFSHPELLKPDAPGRELRPRGQETPREGSPPSALTVAGQRLLFTTPALQHPIQAKGKVSSSAQSRWKVLANSWRPSLPPAPTRYARVALGGTRQWLREGDSPGIGRGR